MNCKPGVSVKIDEPAKQWNAMRALSNPPVLEVFMPDSNSNPSVRPCKKCGTADRYASGVCKVCARASSAAYQSLHRGERVAYAVAYRAKNPDLIKAGLAAYYSANKEKIQNHRDAHPEIYMAYRVAYAAANQEKEKARYAKYRAANKEKMSKSQAARNAKNPERRKAVEKKYRITHPEALRIKYHNRKARATGGVLSRGLTAKLFKLQKGKCPCCAQPLGADFHMDHKMPLALGGANTDDNIQLLRSLCNTQKSAKHPVDFMQSRGFLL